MTAEQHTARQGILNYLTGRALCSVPRPVDEAEGLLDAYRDEVLAAPTVSPSAPADRGELRDRIAEALMGPDCAGTLDPAADEMIDAVLAVLPPPADRGAVLRELIAKAEEWDGHITVQELRRLAAEAPQPETQAESGAMAIMLVPCSMPRCDTTPGESCSTHKRLWAHVDGEHELCGAECSAAEQGAAGSAEGVQR